MPAISEDVECQESTSDSKSNDRLIKNEESESTHSSSTIENSEEAVPSVDYKSEETNL